LDCALIRAVDQSVRATVILAGILDVAHKLGHRVVADGVETLEQVLALRELGCDFVQGSFLGEPTPKPGPAG
jgi:diguanylate cyclase